MIDLKLLRSQYEDLQKALDSRNATGINLKELQSLDSALRDKMQEAQKISSERNKLSKQIGIIKSKGEDASSIMEQVALSKELEAKLVAETKEMEEDLNNKLAYIPNTPHASVPLGKDESENKEVKKHGTPKEFSFTPKEHFEIGEALGMMDFETAANMSGSRFVILKGKLARLERALANFMIDYQTQKNGYNEVSTPVLVNESALYNTSQLPKFSEDLFKTTNDKWLIPTAEVSLTNIVANQIINEETLPIRNAALTLCFRSEAGSAGRDTKGMLRQHQFSKVELVSVVKAEESYDELERMLQSSESILQQLEIPYRVMLLCTGDMGFAAAKTYDIEVWLPGQNSYREISSCSNCEDFQARRMKARIKNKETGKTEFVHTLNGSGLAVGRTLIAIIENYQQEDGSILIPKVLQPYLNGEEKI